MAENSKIEWTHHTVNFWWGCSKVSPACANCYAEGQVERFHSGNWGPNGSRRIRVEAASREAMKYQRQAAKDGIRLRVFTNSMSDFFEDRRDLDIPRLEALDVIRKTPDLDWLILTKRPERIVDLLKLAIGPSITGYRMILAEWLTDWMQGNTPRNVWLGTTVEDQERADQRIPALLQVPAAVRFLSCEPLLGKVLLDNRETSWLTCNGSEPYGEPCLTAQETHGDAHFHGIDWVICGGESGPHARPMQTDWARGLRDQCAKAGVPFLFKQWGEFCTPNQLGEDAFQRWDAAENAAGNPFLDEPMRFGKRTAGRHLDDVLHNGYPTAHTTD